MRKIKITQLIVALLFATSLSSCLNSGTDDGYNYDIYNRYVTVKQGIYGEYLVDDNGGYSYFPNTSTTLSPLKEYKRAIVCMKLKEGEVITDSKKRYNISSVLLVSPIPNQGMNTQSDTLASDKDFLIYSLNSDNYKLWAKNGYINVPFKYYVNRSQNDKVSDFQLYVTDVKEDTLYTHFRKISETDTQYNTSNGIISFEMPFENYIFSQQWGKLEPVNDSVVIKITAIGPNNVSLVQTTKYNYNER